MKLFNSKNKKMHFKVKNFLMLFIAGIINATGVTLLLLPAGFYDSGVSGVSMLINNLTPNWLLLYIPLIVINLPIFIFASKSQGREFTVYSIYAVLIYSLFSYFFQNLIPTFVTDFFAAGSPIGGTDKVICAIFGGMLSGIGSGLAIRFGGSMDGMESLSVIFAKKFNLSVGNFVLIFNIFLYLIVGIISYCGVMPNNSANDFTPALYSIVAYFAASKAIDFISDGLDQAKGAIIITSKKDDVCKALSDEFGRGLTLIDAKGYYSNSKKQVIYCVINRFQVARLRNIILEVENTAFVTVMDISDVIGTSIKFSTKDRKKKLNKTLISAKMDEVLESDEIANQVDGEFSADETDFESTQNIDGLDGIKPESSETAEIPQIIK